MANPERTHSDVRDPGGTAPGNDPRIPDPKLIQTDRGMGTSVLIAAVVLVLAAIAYFAFGPTRTTHTTTSANQPAATQQSTTPMAAAPKAPAEPAKQAPAQPAPAQ